ncbi:hypothetical protein LIER_17128 [Lithospermum erythrorhizon]|uniref:Uncharacterized protein n=1 Tax=Lithospermum erythrorhizon TaxID=34254 RepID=A0AAV3QD98_LITER
MLSTVGMTHAAFSISMIVTFFLVTSDSAFSRDILLLQTNLYLASLSCELSETPLVDTMATFLKTLLFFILVLVSAIFNFLEAFLFFRISTTSSSYSDSYTIRIQLSTLVGLIAWS